MKSRFFGSNQSGEWIILSFSKWKIVTDLKFYVNQGLVKGAKLCLNPYFFGWLEK